MLNLNDLESVNVSRLSYLNNNKQELEELKVNDPMKYAEYLRQKEIPRQYAEYLCQKEILKQYSDKMAAEKKIAQKKINSNPSCMSDDEKKLYIELLNNIKLEDFETAKMNKSKYVEFVKYMLEGDENE